MLEGRILHSRRIVSGTNLGCIRVQYLATALKPHNPLNICQKVSYVRGLHFESPTLHATCDAFAQRQDCRVLVSSWKADNSTVDPQRPPLNGFAWCVPSNNAPNKMHNEADLFAFEHDATRRQLMNCKKSQSRMITQKESHLLRVAGPPASLFDDD